MKKNFVRAMLVTLLCVVMLAVAVNADFAKTNTYSDGMFKDVKTTDWFSGSVKDAYEFGLMKGMGDGKFSPDGTLTVAEGLTIASRIHQTLNGTTIPTSAGEWYQTYVDYAKNSGFMSDGQFDSYTRNIKRFEMASLLADVCKDLPAINTINLVPDVSVTEPYEQKVLSLYRSGILTGNDDYGTFMPFSNLKRSEISAMAVRIADSAKRVTKTFKTVPARYFTDSYTMVYVGDGDGRYGIANAWQLDERSNLYNRTGEQLNYFTDKSTEDFISLYRKINRETEGIVSTEFVFEMNGSDNGIYAGFCSETGTNIVKFTPMGGKLAMVGLETVVTDIAAPADKATTFIIELDIDLDKNTATAVVDNKAIGTVKVADVTLDKMEFASTKAGTGYAKLLYMRMYKNYILCEHFTGSDALSGKGALAQWQSAGFALEKIVSSSTGWTTSPYEVFSAKTKAKAGSVSTASKTFDATTGKLFFSTYILLPEKTDGASVSLKSGVADVFKFETKNGKLVCNGKELYDYVDNAWYRLSVDADTNTGEAQIKINNKVKTTVKFTAKYFDGVDIRFAPAKDAVMWFDDVELMPIVDHYDYPSEPVVAESEDYNLGINICNLWLDASSGEGWDVISPFAEFDSYLGYYDEGLRETTDWETKWFAEHGIDFMHICWYQPASNPTAPIKKAKRAENLEDGYMNSKYSDYVDFCIMWENGSSSTTGLDSFKEYQWKYWVENYFKDDRYVRLDNQAIITVWSRDIFINDFGGIEKAREAVDFMEAELKKLGYDGLILLFQTQSGSFSEANFQKLQDIGADGLYNYHWAQHGWDPDYQIAGINQLRQTSVSATGDAVHYIPTVSVGFNSIGRADERYPFINAEDHLLVCDYIKSTMDIAPKTDTWKDNTVFISTWNEFSEGTHIFPNATNGWRLLDNIRNTFTDAPKHVDEMPTEAQKARVCRTYPANYTPIRRNRLAYQVEKNGVDISNLTVVASYDMSAGGEKFWKANQNVQSLEIKDGVMVITPSGKDNSIVTNENFTPFKAEDVDVARVVMRSSGTVNESDFFFITDKDNKWTTTKRAFVASAGIGKWVEYYVDLSANELYKDTITAIRFDPVTGTGKTEIKLIEFLKSGRKTDTAKPEVLVNGYAMSFDPDIKITDDGDFRVTAEAKNKGFFTILQLKYNMDRTTGDGVLTLTTHKDTTVVLTVGSNKAKVNGVETDLGFTFSLYDGLPVFEMKKLCKLLGYECKMNDAALEIRTVDDPEIYELMFKANAEIKQAKWTFTVPGDSQAWVFQGVADWEAKDGILTVIPSNSGARPDPAMRTGYIFEAKDYNMVVVKVKYNDTMKEYGNSDRPQLFFTTSTSTSFDERKSVHGVYDLNTLDKNGFIDVVFDLTDCSAFLGTITGLRYDAYQKATPFEIDEIRLEYREIEEEDAAKYEPTEKLMEYDGYVLDETVSFEFSGKSDGWVFNLCAGDFSGGFMVLTPAGDKADPYVQHSIAGTADYYGRLVIGVEYTSIMSEQDPQLFFTTVASPGLSSDKCITGKYIIPEGARKGMSVMAVFDLASNKLFTGELKSFRFDPYNDKSQCVIDYMRFYRDPSTVTHSADGKTRYDGFDIDETVSYEFDSKSDEWVFNLCTGTFEDGFMVVTPEGDKADPFVQHTMSGDASYYKRLVIGVKYNSEMKKQKPELFFTTVADPTPSTPKCIIGTYDIPSNVEEGSIIRAVFDLTTNSLFTGELKTIRFDPYNAKVVCSIDYIRFYKGTEPTVHEIAEDTSAEKTQTPEAPQDDGGANFDGYTLDSSVSYEFNGASDGWIFNLCAGSFRNGYMVLTPNGEKADPYVQHSLTANADEYKRLVIGVRLNSDMKKQNPELFFTTVASPGLSSDKCIVGKYVIPAGARDGDLVKAVFDLTANEQFTGELKAMRFDPYNAKSECFVDFIRFYK